MILASLPLGADTGDSCGGLFVGVSHASLTEVATDVRHLHFRIAGTDDLKCNACASTVLTAAECLRMLDAAYLLPRDELVFKVLLGVDFLVFNALALTRPQKAQSSNRLGYTTWAGTAFLIVQVPICEASTNIDSLFIVVLVDTVASPVGCG